MSHDAPTDDFGRPLTGWGMLALVALVTRDELGYTCEVEDCLEVARWSMTWPGRAPVRQCQRHYDWTLRVAESFTIDQAIRLAARPLEVKRCDPEPEDPTAERFAAMELT